MGVARQTSETIVQFIAALRHLSEHCNYGDSLADMLRDRLVCGVNHDGIQRKLLSENNLTYDKAYELSVAVETAERDTRDLIKSRSVTTFQNVFYNRDTSTRHPPHSPNFRNSNAQRHQPNEPISCYRCGDAHLANVCRFKDSVCQFCNKKDIYNVFADQKHVLNTQIVLLIVRPITTDRISRTVHPIQNVHLHQVLTTIAEAVILLMTNPTLNHMECSN